MAAGESMGALLDESNGVGLSIESGDGDGISMVAKKGTTAVLLHGLTNSKTV